MDDKSELANDLRKALVKLKIDVLKAQSIRMGIIVPGEDISAKALKQIQESVVELNYEELQKEITHWTDLSRKVAKLSD